MKTLSIRIDTPAFQREMKNSGNGRVSPIHPRDVALLSTTAYVLVGERTAAFGGGLASTGYVIQDGRATHSIPVTSAEVNTGHLICKSALA